MTRTAAMFKLVALAVGVCLTANACAAEQADLRPAPAAIEQGSSVPLTEPVSAADDDSVAAAAAPTPLTIPASGPATRYVFYNETNGFRGNEPGNELVLASFDDAGVMTVWHTWPNDVEAPEGAPAYLTEQGTLLVAGTSDDVTMPQGIPIGSWPTLRLLDADGSLLWEHTDCDASRCLHHDIEPLPNGNVLVLAYYRVAADEALRYGLDTVDGVWMDEVLELRPIFGDDAASLCSDQPWCTETVWRWTAADHVVTPAEPSEPVSTSPELIDLRTSDGGVDGIDPLHFNGIDYNPNLGQVALSSFSLSEIFIIDHTASGEIRYRWGRPSNYGVPGFDVLGHQHDPVWLDDTTMSVMNNNSPFGELLFDVPSEVLTIELPLTADGQYAFGGGRYGPDAPTVVVDREREPLLNAPFMSGAAVQPDGSAIVSLSLTKELASFDSTGATEWLVKLPGPGGQIWKAQVLAPTSPEIVALTGRTGPLTPSQHRCDVDPDAADCQSDDAAPSAERDDQALPGSDRSAPTAQVGGVWSVSVEAPNGTIEQPLELEQVDDQLVGFVNTFALVGTVQGNVVSFSTTLNTPLGDQPARFELVADEQSMTGVVVLDGLPIDLPPQQVTASR